jgi:hypothetical protein
LEKADRKMLKANQTQLWRKPSAISYRADGDIAELVRETGFTEETQGKERR